jgi:hypothetical protein
MTTELQERGSPLIACWLLICLKRAKRQATFDEEEAGSGEEAQAAEELEERKERVRIFTAIVICHS